MNEEENPAHTEEKVYGLNACRAIFRHRRADIRRVYVESRRMDDVRDLLKWCARAQIAYKVITTAELQRVTKSTHHEGVALLARRPDVPDFASWLQTRSESSAPCRLLLLENVRDPHNVGAIVRIAAHFGVAALLAVGETAARSGAMLRTAEGGGEAVPVFEQVDVERALRSLRTRGFTLLATSSHVSQSLFEAQPLPARCVLMLGAEREGLSSRLLRRADARLLIPGSGAVESLNVATAAAVILAELWRQHGADDGNGQGARSLRPLEPQVSRPGAPQSEARTPARGTSSPPRTGQTSNRQTNNRQANAERPNTQQASRASSRAQQARSGQPNSPPAGATSSRGPGRGGPSRGGGPRGR